MSKYYEIYDVDEKYVYLVMEFIEGESLLDILCKQEENCLEEKRV